jgi:hypothetical protein
MHGQQVAVRAVGNGGEDELSAHINGTEACWALLRCPASQGASKEKLVTITCAGAGPSAAESKEMLSLSSHVLQLFGPSDFSLDIAHGQELAGQLDVALSQPDTHNISVAGTLFAPGDAAELEAKAERALHAIGNEGSSCNWVLLEPAKLQLHGAGCGGLEELKEHLLTDKVLFGVLRFTFPRAEPAPPIVKYLFVHWIGSKVSVVRRGQWNSKLEDAALKIRKFCDFAFRKTAYAFEDLELAHLIGELGRVTCVTSSDTRQFSVDWYLESLGPYEHEVPLQLTTQRDSAPLDEDISDNKWLCVSDPLLRESAKHVIQVVREQGRQWTWVLLALAEFRDVSSGGA